MTACPGQSCPICMETQLRELRATLAFYASPDTYVAHVTEPGLARQQRPIDLDRGERARRHGQ